MKKFKLILPLLAILMAVTVSWTTRPNKVLSDKIWFEVNQDGSPKDANAGVRSDMPPLECNGSNILCARSLSLNDGEASLNSGSTTTYHINSGFSTQDDYDFEAYKQQ